MEVIRFLGDILAKRISISAPAARGLLKLSIKDEIGSFVEFNKINFTDLCNVINNSFKRRLIKLNVLEYESIIKELLDQLTKNQSLITMTGV